jgi:L-threonylcarbamoyladenylate synthase
MHSPVAPGRRNAYSANVASERDIEEAVRVLGARGLIAFPTETVYGLGADAESHTAIARVFEVKGRPRSHPLIVHVPDVAAARAYSAEWPAAAETLAGAFWPGPLTLIVRRSARAIDAVTGGLATVALRVPAHPVALAILTRFGRGVAAPSANRFSKVSPTTAAHVAQDLGREVDFIVDGGACSVGLESTIVDVSSGVPRLLRPGAVTREQIESLLGAPVLTEGAADVRAPGEHALHYAPRALVELRPGTELERRAQELRAEGKSVVVIARSAPPVSADGIHWFTLPPRDEDAARELYALLRLADEVAADVVVTSVPVEAGIGVAIADRLRRAAGPRSK